MIDEKTVTRMAKELEALLAEKCGQTSGPFALRLKRGVRRAPRSVRHAAVSFAQTFTQMGHPKLARLMDASKVDDQYDILRSYLRGIDVADRRKGLLLSVLGSVSFSLLAMLALLLIFLRWRGYL